MCATALLAPCAGLPTKLVGFDLRELTGHQGGKPKAIAALREQYPYDTVAMVGDGITDLEAMQQSGGADLFVGFGGAWGGAECQRGMRAGVRSRCRAGFCDALALLQRQNLPQVTL